MPRLFCNAVTLNYQRRMGSGPPLVLVHGLATNLAFWYFRIVPLLTRDFNVMVYDLRGHGQSDMPPSGYTTADMAADLQALLERLGVKRAHIVGHSYGGSVALHYTVLYPERVRSLTLADVRIRVIQPIPYLADWSNAASWKRMLQELGVSVAFNHPDSECRVLEALAEAKIQGRAHSGATVGLFSPFGMPKQSNRTAERWLQLIRTTTACKDFTDIAGLTLDKIAQVKPPVLALFGEFSNCLPSYWGLKRHLPNCKTVMVPEVGHFHPITRPVLFERNLSKFLGEVAA